MCKDVFVMNYCMKYCNLETNFGSTFFKICPGPVRRHHRQYNTWGLEVLALIADQDHSMAYITAKMGPSIVIPCMSLVSVN